MKLVLIFSVFVLTGISVSNGQVVCHSGMRTSRNKVVQTDTYRGSVCFPGQVCQATVLRNDSDISNIDTLELGNCISTFNTQSCPQALAAHMLTTVTYSNCSTFTCNSFLCNAPSLPLGCSNQELPDDIQVLPNCTLRQSYTMGMDCIDPYFKGLPYSDTALCKANINSAMSCGIGLFPICLTGYCPTVLDVVPTNMPSTYKMVIQQAANYDTIDKLFATLPGLNANIQNEILKAVCLHKDSIYLQNITGLFDSLGAMNINLTFVNPVCDNNAIADLYSYAMAEIPNIINARTHSELCSSISKIRTYALNAWKTRCNKTALIDLIRSAMGPLYSPLLPELEKGINIVESLLQSSEFLGCSAGSTTTSATTSSTASSTSNTTPPSNTVSSAGPQNTDSSTVTPPSTTASPATSKTTDSPAITAEPTSTLAATTTSGTPAMKQHYVHSILVGVLTALTAVAL